MTQNLPSIFAAPSHLQAFTQDARLQALNQDAVKGLSQGSWPRISLKGGRFRLQDPQGQEYVVPHNYLDVVVIATNPHGVSKIYYEGAYDPSGDGTAPTCYSDNGVAPSARAVKPQCGTCAACPHNAWGSKITPSGSQVKACADIKKVAVLLADNTAGPVFELRIPAASLSNFGAYVRGLTAGGLSAASIVTRLSFDVDSDYPKLLFAVPTVHQGQEPWQHFPYINAQMLDDVMEVIGSDEVKQCTGENDKPVPAREPRADDGRKVEPSGVYGPVRAPLAGQHISGAPLPVGQVGPTPPPNPNFPHVGQPVQQEAPPVQQEAPPVKTRTRRTKEQMAADSAAAQPSPASHVETSAGPVVPAFSGRRTARPQAPAPVSNRDSIAPIRVPVTDAAMDDLLSQAMKT